MLWFTRLFWKNGRATSNRRAKELCRSYSISNVSCFSGRALFGRILATQGAQIIHQIPNLICRLNLAEGRHSGVPDSVLNDPEQLLLGKALHLLAGEIGRAWIHPSADRRLRSAIGTMTHTALRVVTSASVGSTGFHIRRPWRYSLLACAADHEMRNPIGNQRFKTPRLLERCQIETY